MTTNGSAHAGADRKHSADPCRVLVVDDNAHIAEALRIMLSRSPVFRFDGWLQDAGGLLAHALNGRPAIAVVDIDMPGPDIFEVISSMSDAGLETRAVVFSGLVTGELVARAIEAGAWGYASKNDGEHGLLEVLRSVAEGEVAFSTEARAASQADR